ncbi:PRC-barrel domain-containing protein, partial [Streptomyces sp. NPDC057052]|uniref:PRC-barrel domain-containing protein n=1 Tax=Streptomyces sp. NPDC057052 TaxID=3346010 RepID=UPI00362A0B1D
MIAREQIRNVLDHPVYDGEGHKIGEAKHVFFDDMTGQPEWVTVKTGLFGTSESFVPIRDASMVEDHIEVPYDKERIKGAPNVDVDSGGHLSESEEHRLYDYYGIDWDSVLDDDASGRSGRAAGTGTAAAATGTAAGTAPGMRPGMRPGEADADYRAGRTGDDAMTRSEEQMHVGVERRETGRARLRKYVVTEEVETTVPVRREEV